MKTLALAFGLILLVAELVTGQTLSGRSDTDGQDVKEAIVRLCTAWDDAYIQRDLIALERILADDYIGIDDQGNVTRKPDEIALTKAGDLVIKSVSRIEPLTVRVHGDAAIVTGFSTVTQEYKGADATGQFRFTIVCIQERSRWQIASWQGTRVKPN